MKYIFKTYSKIEVTALLNTYLIRIEFKKKCENRLIQNNFFKLK